MDRIQGLIRNLKMRELRYVVTVSVLKSIRKAASFHGVSQPRLSKILQEIEAELHTQLFVRSGNKTVLTEFGEIFVGEASQALAAIESIPEKIDRVRGHQQHFFKIGAVPNPALRLVAPAFIATLADYPKLTLELEHGLSEQLIEDLKARKYDLVIARAVHDESVASLRHCLLYPETGAIIARQDHPLFSERGPLYEKLSEFPWILPRAGPTRSSIELAFANMGVKLPAPFFVNYDLAMVSSLLTQTDALTVLSTAVAGPLVNSGGFKRVPTHIVFQLPSYAVYSIAGAPISPVQQAFEDALLRAAKNASLR